MIVVDASAAVEFLLNSRLGQQVAQQLLDNSSSVCAPYLLQNEVISVLRGQVLGRVISSERAQLALDTFVDFPITYFPALPFYNQIWARRDQVSAYDGAYVALAQSLGCQLVTCDRRLAKAVPELSILVNV